ncbi:MAG: Na+/H+ antiporter NhaA [Thermodesulfobacteriota bacterium]
MAKPSSKGLFDRFFRSQTSGSIVLLGATLVAIFWANSPWSSLYHTLAHLDIGTHFHGKQYHLTLDHWVKDGLMTIFFFVVGLEIKREILIGELSSFKKAILPVMAAIGGAVVPALIYFAFNQQGEAAKGWAIPMATDIAFALGVLALFGKRVPIGLKVFLTALAIVDDLLAVIVIAIFYTEQIAINYLLVGAVFLGLLAYIARVGVRQTWLHLLLTLIIWVCIFLSGIHATIAGVLIALTVPIKPSLEAKTFFDTICQQMTLLQATEVSADSLVKDKKQRSALVRIYMAAEDMLPAGIHLEDKLHSVQAFLILPLFALFSAGVTVNKEMLAAFPSSVSIGIILGLLLGKQLGITLLSWLTIKVKLAELPAGVSWMHIWGSGVLSGIGFTMSIFISELAFADPATIADAKIAIFVVSVLAAALGFVVLHKSLPPLQESRGQEKAHETDREEDENCAEVEKWC